jgi:heme exporter protein D|tara:strand:- start:175 stop:345 length:171 start_codon:yes stop_codon:yes gene_type:complete
MIEFLQMGGYAVYVWPAYALTALTLAVSVIAPIRRRKRLIRALSAIAVQKERSRPE